MTTLTAPAPARRRSASFPYVPGLDGLRAISVIAVLLYHADLAWIHGGFLGVEVFFVISGYLITALLLHEQRRTGRIDLKHFWIRRARRLLPALFALLVVVTAYSVLFLPDEVARLRGTLVAAVLYCTNWYLVFSHQSYFEAVGRDSLLKHLWSLAVEEQFYLVWPIIFVVGTRIWRRSRFLLAIVIGAGVSALLMAVLYTPGKDPSRVYYGTDTRASGLLLGCALAFVWSPTRFTRRSGQGAGFLLDAVGLAALVLLIQQFLNTGEVDGGTYRGGLLACSLVTVVLIAVTVHPAAHLGRVLGCKPLKWIGERSYGLYLWHWPVFLVTRPHQDLPFGGPAVFIIRMGVTVVLTQLSYVYVETPIRKGALSRWWRRARTAPAEVRARMQVRVLGVSVVSVLAVLGLGAAVVGAKAPPPPSYLAVTETPEASGQAPPTTTAGLDTPPPTDASGGPSSSDPSATTVPGGATATTAAGTPPASDPATTAPATTAAATDPNAPPATTAPAATDPAATTAPAPTPPPKLTAVGDSVMLGAADALRGLGAAGEVWVDARVGRQLTEGTEILQGRAAQNLIGDVVLVHLGNNGSFTAKQLDGLLATVSSARKVIVFNCRVPRTWEDAVNSALQSEVPKYPNAVLVDWRGLTSDKLDMFYGDGIHLRPDGAKYYASLVGQLMGS